VVNHGVFLGISELICCRALFWRSDSAGMEQLRRTSL
jgi:hypothetical protein